MHTVVDRSDRAERPARADTPRPRTQLSVRRAWDVRLWTPERSGLTFVAWLVWWWPSSWSRWSSSRRSGQHGGTVPTKAA